LFTSENIWTTISMPMISLLLLQQTSHILLDFGIRGMSTLAVWIICSTAVADTTWVRGSTWCRIGQQWDPVSPQEGRQLRVLY